MLPKPKSKYGYSDKEINKLCELYGITREVFSTAFGINTVALIRGKLYLYPRDVEKALWKLGIKDGKYHMWD